MTGARVQRLDHVHVEVADRAAAARWFGDLFALVPAPHLAFWADEPGGPLILQGGDGAPCLSLFERPTRAHGARDRTVALRTDGAGFLAFRDRLPELALDDGAGGRLTAEHLVDHTVSWSFYFLDPDGNRFELTTYDYATVDRAVGRT
jgi:catechol 2,3-dioxygenase-like lactoylglutathione lyase family enzyme